LRHASRREWVADFAPDFFTSGEADEGKNAFAERRESDFSKYPRTAGIYVPREG
jgi:1,4-dihydroxy-2-naphthoyl-CoA synthase